MRRQRNAHGAHAVPLERARPAISEGACSACQAALLRRGAHGGRCKLGAQRERRKRSVEQNGARNSCELLPQLAVGPGNHVQLQQERLQGLEQTQRLRTTEYPRTSARNWRLVQRQRSQAGAREKSDTRVRTPARRAAAASAGSPAGSHTAREAASAADPREAPAAHASWRGGIRT